MAGPCSNLADMTGRTVLVTGGNAGIGKATAEGLARLGARVVITARDPARGERAVEDVRLRTGRGQVDWMPLNLASLASVRSFADDFGSRFDRLDVLDLNAGAVHSRRRLTEDGYETQFQVNHLGHFLLPSCSSTGSVPVHRPGSSWCP